MKKVRILTSYFETDGSGISHEKFTAGALVDADEGALRQVELGRAEVIEVEDPAPAVAPDDEPVAEEQTDDGQPKARRGRPPKIA